MTDSYQSARTRGDTQGQHRAAERAKAQVNRELLKSVKRGRRAKLRRALGMA